MTGWNQIADLIKPSGEATVQNDGKLTCEFLGLKTPQGSIQVKRCDCPEVSFSRGCQKTEDGTSRSVTAEGVFRNFRFRFWSGSWGAVGWPGWLLKARGASQLRALAANLANFHERKTPAHRAAFVDVLAQEMV